MNVFCTMNTTMNVTISSTCDVNPFESNSLFKIFGSIFYAFGIGGSSFMMKKMIKIELFDMNDTQGTIFNVIDTWAYVLVNTFMNWLHVFDYICSNFYNFLDFHMANIHNRVGPTSAFCRTFSILVLLGQKLCQVTNSHYTWTHSWL